jgi:hypothetical protein
MAVLRGAEGGFYTDQLNGGNRSRTKKMEGEEVS